MSRCGAANDTQLIFNFICQTLLKKGTEYRTDFSWLCSNQTAMGKCCSLYASIWQNLLWGIFNQCILLLAYHSLSNVLTVQDTITSRAWMSQILQEAREGFDQTAWICIHKTSQRVFHTVANVSCCVVDQLLHIYMYLSCVTRKSISYAYSKDSDQPVSPHILITAFVVCLRFLCTLKTKIPHWTNTQANLYLLSWITLEKCSICYKQRRLFYWKISYMRSYFFSS